MKGILKTTSAVLVAAAIVPAIWMLYVLSARALARPDILSFEYSWEKEIFFTDPIVEVEFMAKDQNWPKVNSTVVRIVANSTRYQAFVIEPFPDWSSFSALSFIAASSGANSVQATIRVHDADHNNRFDDRFNYGFDLSPTPRIFTIPMTEIASAPANRKMDLHNISRIIVFLSNTEGDEELWLDDFRLR